MTLPDHLGKTATTIINLYTSTKDGSQAVLSGFVSTLGYNDAGLLAAYFRGRGDTYIAEYIEAKRIL